MGEDEEGKEGRGAIGRVRDLGGASYANKSSYLVEQGSSQGVFFTQALQHVSSMIVQIWEVKRVACYARAETFTEAVVS